MSPFSIAPSSSPQQDFKQVFGTPCKKAEWAVMGPGVDQQLYKSYDVEVMLIESADNSKLGWVAVLTCTRGQEQDPTILKTGQT